MQCVFQLAELGCNVDAENYEGETPLHIMIRENRWECFMALLSRGARACKLGKDGNSTLHLAIEVVILLGYMLDIALLLPDCI